MKRSIGMVLAALLTLGVVSPCLADWEYDRNEGLRFKSPEFELTVKNRGQFRVAGRFDQELATVDDSASFDVSQYKIAVTGRIFEHWGFRMQANLANGSEASTKFLEDLFFVYKKRRMAQLWIGQGKILMGRQDLTSSGELMFVDRSLAAAEFRHNPPDRSLSRDVGVALIGENEAETYSYYVGVYNGNGINKDEKDNTDYMALARLVVTPFGAFAPSEVNPRNDEHRIAVGVSAFTLTKGTDPLGENLRDLVGILEVAYRFLGINIVGEFFTRSEDQAAIPGTGEIDTDGWYVQGAYLFKDSRWEVAGRYSEILRDAPNQDEIEYGIALNYFHSGNNFKIQSDVRMLEFEDDPASFKFPATPRIDRTEVRIQAQFAF